MMVRESLQEVRRYRSRHRVTVPRVRDTADKQSGPLLSKLVSI